MKASFIFIFELWSNRLPVLAPCGPHERPAPPLPRPVPSHGSRQPWVSFRTRPPGVSQCRLGGGLRLPTMHRALGSGGDRAAAAAAEPRGFAGGLGAWRPGGGVLWGRGQSRSSVLGRPPLLFCGQCPGSSRVVLGLRDLSTWRCSKVVGGSSGPSCIFLGGGVGCEILAVTNRRRPNLDKI